MQGGLQQSLNFIYVLEQGSHCVVHAGPELLGSGGPSVLATQVARTSGVHHHAWLKLNVNNFFEWDSTSLCAFKKCDGKKGSRSVLQKTEPRSEGMLLAPM